MVKPKLQVCPSFAPLVIVQASIKLRKYDIAVNLYTCTLY